MNRKQTDKHLDKEATPTELLFLQLSQAASLYNFQYNSPNQGEMGPGSPFTEKAGDFTNSWLSVWCNDNVHINLRQAMLPVGATLVIAAIVETMIAEETKSLIQI